MRGIHHFNALLNVVLGEPGSLLSAVSNLPINPDAHYTKGLAEFFSDINVNKPHLTATTTDEINLDQDIMEASSPHQLIMCNKGNCRVLFYIVNYIRMTQIRNCLAILLSVCPELEEITRAFHISEMYAVI